MALAWSDAVEALKPLRVRAHQLQNQAAQDYDTQSQRWKQSEKPVLKEHAAGLKNVLQVLIKEEQNLAQRIANLTTSAVPNHPGTTTGFNVIRARTDAEGEPLSTTALRQERDRLLKAFDAMEIHIAEAKAEITKHGRHNEEEIWETKLVALQVCLLLSRLIIIAIYCIVYTIKRKKPTSKKYQIFTGYKASVPRGNQLDRGRITRPRAL